MDAFFSLGINMPQKPQKKIKSTQIGAEHFLWGGPNWETIYGEIIEMGQIGNYCNKSEGSFFWSNPSQFASWIALMSAILTMSPQQERQ